MNSLKYKIPLELNEFVTLQEIVNNKVIYHSSSKFHQLHFKNISAQNWYELFQQKITTSIGNTFLPIYRMADGEFRFVTNNFWITIKRAFFNKNYINTCWGEEYGFIESFELKHKYSRQLKFISENGILATHFVIESDSIGYRKYINGVLNYFDRQKIQLNESNYFPFYFVYALFSSEAGNKLLKNRNILLISNFSSDKINSITEYLNKIEVNNIEFYQISKNKALLDKIELENISIKPDIALVAGGIGSANIICQLQPLQIPCIDIGFIMELYSNTSLRGSRIYVK